MLDLMQRFMPGKYRPVFLYLVQGLDFQEQTLRYYEKAFKIKIEREQHWDVSAYLAQMGQYSGRPLKAADCEKRLREKFDTPFIALGYRKDESLQRRGHLGSLAKDNYIDWRNRKLFPVADFLSSEIDTYVKVRKLYLPPEYRAGFRNIDQFKGRPLLYIKNTYPEDYQKIVSTFPMVEAEVVRMA